MAEGGYDERLDRGGGCTVILSILHHTSLSLAGFDALSFKKSPPGTKIILSCHTYRSINHFVTLAPAQTSYDDWYIARRFRHPQAVSCNDRHSSRFAVIRDGVSVDLARNFNRCTR